LRKERQMKGLQIWVVVAFSLFCFVGTGLAQEEKKAKEEKKSKKMAELEAVISGVGQRTITFQYERKEKVREEVVGIDDKTDIEKDGTKIKLRDLQQTDKVVIEYEPDAYTPAISVKVIGKGEVKKAGGDD